MCVVAWMSGCLQEVLLHAVLCRLKLTAHCRCGVRTVADGVCVHVCGAVDHAQGTHPPFIPPLLAASHSHAHRCTHTHTQYTWRHPMQTTAMMMM